MKPNKEFLSLDVNINILVQALEASVKRNLSEGLLLSGGLDTSILAALATKWQKPYCVTVALKGAPAPDIEYAKKVAALFDLKHDIHYFGEEELEEGIQAVIRILGSFDPMEIRNSAACYVGLKAVKEKGLSSVMTGDGGDELLAGYSFFFDLTKEQLAAELSKMWTNMSFSSIPLAGNLGIEVRLPFLDPEFKTLAMNLDPSLKVRKKNGQTFGKWILRQAFESVLSAELVWRVKAPLEVGTGTTTLPSFFDARIPDSEFSKKKASYFQEDRVTIRTKEHLHYYEIYRNRVGIPYLSAGEGRKCPECGGKFKDNTAYCRICGAYPI
jgi:asparagine synthase (glutamine-hydrolysing)